MKLKPYPSYMNSGIPQLGNIPVAWSMLPVSRLFDERRESPEPGDELVSAFITGEVTLRSNKPENIIKNSGTETGYKRIIRGDLVFSGMNAHIGGLGISDSTGRASPVYIVLKKKPKVYFNDRYTYWLLRHYALSGYIASLTNTIRFNSADLRYGDIKVMSVLLPSHSEQTAIATFLDRETAKLDTLIAKQEKLIELLQEKRQAVISHAVTKGLDPVVPMKDSGVEWLGEVPAHWQMTPMRFVSNLNPPVSFNEVNEDDELIFLPMDQIKNGFHLLNRAPLSKFNSSYNTFEKGDILLAKVTPCFENGNIAIAEDRGFGTSEIFVLRPTNIDPRYFYWYLQSEFFKMDGAASMTGAGGLKRVSSDVPQKHHIPKPPMNEQTTIANYIDQHTAKIDRLIQKAQRSIDLAKEHRTALISAAVTGKIDVREAA